MAQLNVSELNIMNVTQYKLKRSASGFIIVFTIDGVSYRLRVEEQEDGKIYPIKIMHDWLSGGCKYCDEPSYYCHELMNYKQELFHRLIQFPSIRLEWLYINHV